MTIKMTETELLRLGYTVDPSNPSQFVSVNPDDLPDDSWTFDRLMTYGCAAVKESNQMDHDATCLARRSTVQIYRAGRALSLARTKVPLGQKWTECLRQHDIPRTNAWEAIQLFKRARSEEAVVKLTRTEAKHRFKITKPKMSPKDEEMEVPSTLRFPKVSNEDQGQVAPPADDGDQDVVDDDADLGVVDDLHLDDEVADVAENSDDEAMFPETVFELLVSINADLGVAVCLPVELEDRERIEAEITKAHKLLDQIEIDDESDEAASKCPDQSEQEVILGLVADSLAADVSEIDAEPLVTAFCGMPVGGS